MSCDEINNNNLIQQKEREAFMEMIHVMIAFIIIMAMAAGTVALKLSLFPDETVQGFKPMPQQVMVVMMISLTQVVQSSFFFLFL